MRSRLRADPAARPATRCSRAKARVAPARGVSALHRRDPPGRSGAPPAAAGGPP
jgi:hypothetical protein